MLESKTKRKKIVKKSPLVNLSKSSSILENNGRSVAISARKAGRQRLRQEKKWETSDADTAGEFLK